MKLEELGEGFALIDYEYLEMLLCTNRLWVRDDEGKVFRIESSRMPTTCVVIWDVSSELKKKGKVPLIVTQQELPNWVIDKTNKDFLVLLDRESCYFKNRDTIAMERTHPDYSDEDWNFPNNNYVLLINLKHLVVAGDILESIIVRKDGC